MNDQLMVNFEHIGPGTYICRTQAGFKNALKVYANAREEPFKDAKSKINKYPLFYPCQVSFHFEYPHAVILVSILPLEKVLETLKRRIAIVEKHIAFKPEPRQENKDGV